jgi:lipoprotein
MFSVKFSTPFILLCIAITISFTSCDKKEAPKGTAIKTSNQVANSETSGNTLAYVEVDSLLTQYEFCIKEKAALEAKSKQYEAQINAKMSQFQKASVDFQQKVQSGAFTSQAQGEAAQQRLIRMQQEGAKLQQDVQQRMLKAQEKFNKTLRDSVQSFLKDYNREKHYDMIISKQGDNVLYANDKLDITKEVVDGLNKRFKNRK